MNLTLPLDVLLHIIELLAARDDDSIKSLQILSQTCKFMVPICRKYLFSSLHLVSDWGPLVERLGDLLSKNPEIAHYVTSLSYHRPSNRISEELIIFNIMLKVRSPLQSIELFSPGVDWNDYSESIRLSLLSLIELPTVTHLKIYCLTRFPATALSGCSNLIDLQLGYLDLALPEVNQVISRSKIPTPVSLDIMSGTYGFADLLVDSASLHAGSPIDFSRVQMATFGVTSRGEIDNIIKLIKVTRHLQYIYIMMHLPLELAGLGESLAIDAYRTLTSLRLNTTITIADNDLDPLCGLSRELGFIAGNNILEVLQLDVWFKDASSYLTRFELWSAFDSVLADSGAFPVLRRVSVEFGWFSKHWSEPEKDAILEGLKENKFPRLVESEAVEFNFSVSEI